jgi:hypothetical protein
VSVGCGGDVADGKAVLVGDAVPVVGGVCVGVIDGVEGTVDVADVVAGPVGVTEVVGGTVVCVGCVRRGVGVAVAPERPPCGVAVSSEIKTIGGITVT